MGQRAKPILHCIRCKKDLPRENFRLVFMTKGATKKYPRSSCKKCQNNIQKNRRKSDPSWPLKLKARWQEYREKYPEKVKARLLLHKALQSNIIVRKPCEVCGNEKSDGHHTDYLKPLDVRWLCREHHLDAHYPNRIK